MRATWPLWLLALALKSAGASWDVSWHFQTTRDLVTPPHLLNALGQLLFLALFVHAWRRRAPEHALALRTIVAGMLVWIVAVPLDELWHRMYGVDLTTWSPSHLMLFYGTAIATAGVALLFLAEHGWRPGRAFDARGLRFGARATLALLVLFVAAALLFPLSYHEHTTVAIQTFLATPDAMDPALQELARVALALPEPAFYGTPDWLYPVYCVGAVALVAVLVRRALGPGWLFAALAVYVAARFAADVVLGGAGFPRAVVPWHYLALALAWEAAWVTPARRAVQVAIGAGLSTVGAYLAWAAMRETMLALPISAASAPVALFAALSGAALAWYAWDVANDPRAGNGPLAMAVRRRWEGWEASARDLVARLR